MPFGTTPAIDAGSNLAGGGEALATGLSAVAVPLLVIGVAALAFGAGYRSVVGGSSR